MISRSRFGSIAVISTALLVLIAAGLTARHYLQAPSGTLLTSEPCELQNSPCIASGSGQQVLFAIDSPLSNHNDLQLRVELSGMEADSVAVSFDGVEMYMGYNRVVLTRGDDGGYHAKTPLPVCVTGAMAWRATVEVTHDAVQTRAAFLFTTP